VGTSLTITGLNFGAAQGTSTVTFNGTAATPTSWSSTSIVVPVPTGVTTGNVVVTVNGQASNGVQFTVAALPGAWLDQDVGAVGIAGSASYADNKFTVTASGADIWGNADAMNFLYQSLAGDGTLVARVVSMTGGGTYHKAGVMIRETLTAGSTNAFSLFQGDFVFHYRSTTGGSTSEQVYATEPLPYWVKIVRSGNNFSGYTSADGATWVQLGSTQTISMAASVYIGMAVTSNNNSVLATASFDNVSLTTGATAPPVITSLSGSEVRVGDQVTISGSGFGNTQGSSTVYVNDAPMTINSWSTSSISITIPAGATSGPLVVSLGPSMNDSNTLGLRITTMPPPWLDQDIGSVAVVGSASYAGGIFALQGSGNGINQVPADGFHFAYQTLTGDGAIVARVSSINSGYTLAGVMIRETLNAGATSFSTCQNVNGIEIVYRTTTSQYSTYTIGSSPPLPYWVKLVRSGNNFTGFSSDDGVNWVQVGATQTITMAQTVYIGLAVGGGGSGLDSGTLDNVSVTSTARLRSSPASRRPPDRSEAR
jgi:hypothetical protein